MKIAELLLLKMFPLTLRNILSLDGLTKVIWNKFAIAFFMQ